MTCSSTGTLRRRPPGWRPGLCTCLALATALLAQGAPPADPLPVPDYSFDVESPSVDEGYVLIGDILELDFPHPAPVLSGAALGLWSPLDDIDALSAGNAAVSTEDVFALLFSVDRLTVGAAAPDPQLVAEGVPYNAQDQSGRGHAAGDQFFSTESFSKLGQLDPAPGAVRRNNFLTRNNFDEGGTDFSAYPPTHAYTELGGATPQDRVNAAARLARHGPEQSIECLYFSLSPESPSLETLSGACEPSGAHIFFAFDLATLRGACCLDDSTCELLTEAECREALGLWLGASTPCETCMEPRADAGACCLGDGTCETLDELTCWDAGGAWLGLGTTCDMCEQPPPIEDGACCFDGGTCEILDELTCWDAWGAWLGPETTCDMCDLPPMDTGACCLYGAGCEILTETDCYDALGFWLGPLTTCELCENPAGGEGACCFDDGTCEILDDFACWDARGYWLGPDTACEMCEGLGAAMIVLPYASHAELGLVQADNIDALIVFDADEDGWFGGEDLVLFSLAPGSPSLSTIPEASAQGAAADVFAASPGSPPAVFAAAGELGLGAPADNIDALNLDIYSGKSRQSVQHGIRSLPGDVNDDCIVDLEDLSVLLTNYRTSGAEWGDGDVTGDGEVDLSDLGALLAVYGTTCK